MTHSLLRATGAALLVLGLAACQSEPDNALVALDDALLEGDNRTAAPAAANATDTGIVVDPRVAGAATGNAPAATPGALAKGRKNAAACATEVDYSPQWAEKLPRDLPMTPDARLIEAAGNATGDCALRVVNFTTALPVEKAIDWYQARATKAGYSAERQRDGAQHVLGGVRERDGAAYVVFLSARREGGTEIDLVANRGV
ncbi:hypothetical protein GO308_17120 [Sphingomonas sp. SFZ2018-12]|uniref:hypothetical protein n=1 Tax=Sphingomonas sp. SFZ2018-12 TaxID=2683197 RepID=UPI001F0FCA2C|nr:hypothetical protein [Sphingomonas sp. SFZ2018-12]MCH4894829.1 hypothetical protein [Sphingomonas sp. SFZ2018-12]